MLAEREGRIIHSEATVHVVVVDILERNADGMARLDCKGSLWFGWQAMAKQWEGVITPSSRGHLH